MSTASANDIHAVLVLSAIDREDVLARATENASTSDVAGALKRAIDDRDSGALIDELKRLALVASAKDLDAQSASALSQVRRETAPMKRQPAESVPAVKNEDIAAARAAKMVKE